MEFSSCFMATYNDSSVTRDILKCLHTWNRFEDPFTFSFFIFSLSRELVSNVRAALPSQGTLQCSAVQTGSLRLQPSGVIRHLSNKHFNKMTATARSPTSYLKWSEKISLYEGIHTHIHRIM